MRSTASLYKILLALLALATFYSTTAHAYATKNKILKKYTIEQLDAAANLLRTVMDYRTVHCHLKTRRAGLLMQPLHALIDAKVAREAKFYKKNLKKFGNCQRGCHCGVYTSILEKVNNLDGREKELAQRVRGYAEKFTPLQSDKCAIPTSKWFCQSPLLQYLKQETATIQ